MRFSDRLLVLYTHAGLIESHTSTSALVNGRTRTDSPSRIGRAFSRLCQNTGKDLPELVDANLCRKANPNYCGTSYKVSQSAWGIVSDPQKGHLE